MHGLNVGLPDVWLQERQQALDAHPMGRTATSPTP